jgi:hypothetical protein
MEFKKNLCTEILMNLLCENSGHKLSSHTVRSSLTVQLVRRNHTLNNIGGVLLIRLLLNSNNVAMSSAFL